MYDKSIEEALKLTASSEKGLTSSEALARLEKNGKNVIQDGKIVPGWLRFLKQLKHTMMIILFIAMGLSIVISIIDTNANKWLDAALIAFIILLNASIGYFQEGKAEKSIEALKKASKPYAKVIRDGETIRVKTEDLVVGDIVLLEAGDIVPADMRLIETASLMIEEAALTGESVPTEKTSEIITGENLALGDRLNMAFTSGIVSYGRGKGVAVATGMETQIGLIAKHLAKEKAPATPLTKSIEKTSRIIAAVVAVVCAVIFLVNVLTGGDIFDSIMLTIAIAVCSIPEAIPICVTITMALGVQRMSKRKAIIRNLPAVETLGSTEIICSDKTGSITLNKMTVQEVYTNVGAECLTQLYNCMTLCNDAQGEIGDPTETALVRYTESLDIKKDALDKKYPRINELPFDSSRKLMSTLHKTDIGTIMYTKGALDNLLNRCSMILDNGKARQITEEDRKKVNDAASDFAKKALRILGYAYKHIKKSGKLGYDEEKDLILIGFSGMIDPPREEVFKSIKICKSAGITTIMITGDHKDTAYAIAKQIGIADDETQVITGAQLQSLDDDELLKNVLHFRVYTRVNPEDKLRIVKALKTLNKVVAMTGDGVNDAPSIKAADIGIGMGITGTEVTKGAADVILTDDNFATIVSAVEEGRRTYSNILKIVIYLVGLSLAELILLVGFSLAGIAVGLDLPFFNPLLILWVNVVTDTLPAIALGSLPAEKNIMNQKPNSTKGSLLRGITGFQIITYAFFMVILVATTYLLGMFVFGFDATASITMSYIILALYETVHPYNLVNKTESLFKQNPFKSRALNLAVLITLILVVASIMLPIPAFQNALGITWLTWDQWLIAIGIGLLVIPMVELYKVFQKMRAKKASADKNNI